MNTIKSLDNKILENKIQILRFIINIFLIINLLVLALYASYIFRDYKSVLKDRVVIYMVFSLVTFSFFFILRRKLSTKSIKRTLYLITSLLSFAAIILVMFTGIGVVAASVLVYVIITVVAIVDSVKNAWRLIFSYLFIYLLIFALHTLTNFYYVPDSTQSSFSNIFFFSLMIMSFGYVVKLGYAEIENSYSEAVNYAKELEKLNKQLDERVKNRTERLTENFNRTSESLYKAAMVGSITRPLLHDIATPISSLKGSIELLKNEHFKDKELLEIIESSTEQIDVILRDSRELIRGNMITNVFSVSKTIKKIIKIISSELRINDIIIDQSVKEDFELKVNQSIFERCILNLLLNSIEELVQKDGERRITIIIDTNDQFGFVEVMDNGRGIPQNIIDQIFLENFSQKNTTDNLGLGLPFVKNNIENNLKGEIKVESVVNQYTKFKIKLNAFKENPISNK